MGISAGAVWSQEVVGTSSLSMNSSPLPPSSEQLQILAFCPISVTWDPRCFLLGALVPHLENGTSAFLQQVIEGLNERMQRSLF